MQSADFLFNPTFPECPGHPNLASSFGKTKVVKAVMVNMVKMVDAHDRRYHRLKPFRVLVG